MSWRNVNPNSPSYQQPWSNSVDQNLDSLQTTAAVSSKMASFEEPTMANERAIQYSDIAPPPSQKVQSSEEQHNDRSRFRAEHACIAILCMGEDDAEEGRVDTEADQTEYHVQNMVSFEDSSDSPNNEESCDDPNEYFRNFPVVSAQDRNHYHTQNASGTMIQNSGSVFVISDTNDVSMIVAEIIAVE